MIAGSDSDEAFYSAVYSTLFRLGTYGHLWIVEPEEYQAYLEAYQSDELEDRAHWREVLTSPSLRRVMKTFKSCWTPMAERMSPRPPRRVRRMPIHDLAAAGRGHRLYQNRRLPRLL